MPDTVEKIEELTVFKTTDGKLHETMDAACDHQERLEFIEWCENQFGCHLRDDRTSDLVDTILRHWKVSPK